MINKGVGKQVEFKGLRAQYVFIFAGGLLGVFVLFVVLYMMGAPPVVCITIALVLGYCAGLVHFSFERRIWGSRADETCCAASVSPEDKFSENPCKAHRQNERNPGPLAVDKRFKCLKRINIPNTYEKHFEKKYIGR